MGKLKKTALLIGGLLSAATAVVAIQNVIDVNHEGQKHKQGFYEKYVKRPLDFFLSVLATILLSPVLVATAVLVRVRLGTPVLFTQERPGKDEKIFKLMKFRTMTDKRDENGELLPDADRLTKLGSFLRATSIDELPELLNIAKGDMSIIGPRPLLVQYLPYYQAAERHRHDVRPGLSGLAQVNGRNLVDWDHRLAYDVQYVSDITFIGDVKIALKTIRKVFAREDVVVNTDTVETFLDQERAIHE